MLLCEAFWQLTVNQRLSKIHIWIQGMFNAIQVSTSYIYIYNSGSLLTVNTEFNSMHMYGDHIAAWALP